MNLLQAYKFHGARDINMKFGDTLVYHTLQKTWDWFREAGSGGAYFNYIRSSSSWDSKTTPLSELANYAVISPQNKYYNFKRNRQAYLLARLPVRGTKQTCSPERNTRMFSPFWDKLPRSIRTELVPIVPYSTSRDAFMFYTYVLSGAEPHLNFVQALEEVVSNDRFSCSISDKFAVSMSFTEDAYNILYFDNEIGLIDLAQKKVRLLNNVVAQELSDLFSNTNVKWSLELVEQPRQL